MAKIKLYHPQYAGLSYGGNNEIRFGLAGGFEPHYLFIDEDHPLLPALLEAEPDIRVITDDAGPATVYVCSDHPDREFKTKQSLKAHMTAKGHGKDGDENPA